MILQVLLCIEHDMLQAFGEETDKKKRQRKKHTELMMSHRVFLFFVCVCVITFFSHWIIFGFSYKILYICP